MMETVHISNFITGRVSKGRNLIEKNGQLLDSYLQLGPVDATLRFYSKKKKQGKQKSEVVKKSCNPTWNADFSFTIEDKECSFKIEVWDAKSDSFMGQVVLPSLLVGNVIEGWYPLKSRSGKEDDSLKGEVRISLIFSGSEDPRPNLCFNIVTTFIQWLEKRAMTLEGLFRISGLEPDVRSLYNQLYDQSKVPVISDELMDCHVVTGALKLYLRSTKEPLIPYEFYCQFIDVQKNDEQNIIQETKKLVLALPRNNQCILIHLMAFLRRVTENQQYNKMDSGNLAIVFGPTVLRDPNPGVDINAVNKQSRVVQLFIEYFFEIFGEKAEEEAIKEGTTVCVKDQEEKIKKEEEEKTRTQNFKTVPPNSEKFEEDDEKNRVLSIKSNERNRKKRYSVWGRGTETSPRKLDILQLDKLSNSSDEDSRSPGSSKSPLTSRASSMSPRRIDAQLSLNLSKVKRSNEEGGSQQALSARNYKDNIKRKIVNATRRASINFGNFDKKGNKRREKRNNEEDPEKKEKTHHRTRSNTIGISSESTDSGSRFVGLSRSNTESTETSLKKEIPDLEVTGSLDDETDDEEVFLEWWESFTKKYYINSPSTDSEKKKTLPELRCNPHSRNLDTTIAEEISRKSQKIMQLFMAEVTSEKVNKLEKTVVTLQQGLITTKEKISELEKDLLELRDVKSDLKEIISKLDINCKNA